MTIASTPIASSVMSVSRIDSPLLTLDPFADTLIASALSHLAASSNEERVRVESSKKRLTTVRPRNAGSFLMGRDCTSCISSAVASSVSISSRLRSAMPRRCFTRRSVRS